MLKWLHFCDVCMSFNGKGPHWTSIPQTDKMTLNEYESVTVTVSVCMTQSEYFFRDATDHDSSLMCSVQSNAFNKLVKIKLYIKIDTGPYGVLCTRGCK